MGLSKTRLDLIYTAFVRSGEPLTMEAMRKQYRYETGQDVSEAEVLKYLPKQKEDQR